MFSGISSQCGCPFFLFFVFKDEYHSSQAKLLRSLKNYRTKKKKKYFSSNQIILTISTDVRQMDIYTVILKRSISINKWWKVNNKRVYITLQIVYILIENSHHSTRKNSLIDISIFCYFIFYHHSNTFLSIDNLHFFSLPPPYHHRSSLIRHT